MSHHVNRMSIAAFICAVLLPTLAWTQQGSGIGGVVRDSSGGAMPGVTVEAASPALIEKVRTVVTDGEGRYNIVDLRPGVYSVTFTLSGFNTFRREGVALTAGFTATVNADMNVGSLEETITVTGAAPLVDAQNVRQQNVLSSDLLTALPTGRTSVVNLIALTPGYTGNPDVGGSTGAYGSQQTKGRFHGKKGSWVLYDGSRIDNYAGSGDSAGYLYNSETVLESSVETGGAGADSGAPNVGINMIPKEGSNVFKYTVSGVYTNNHLQNDNLDDGLRARGVLTVPKVYKLYDGAFNLGGPIKKDRLWFFTSIRRWGVRSLSPGIYWNKTQGTPFFTPDLNRPAFRDEQYQSHAVRLTWQVSPKNKVNIFNDIKADCICETGGSYDIRGGATAAQEAGESWHLWPNGIVQGTWTSPRTSKLLLEAGASVVMFHWPNFLLPGVSEDDVSIRELSTGFVYNNQGAFDQSTLYPKKRIGDRYSERFSLSYVTGSHSFKTGFQLEQAYARYASIGLGRPEAKGVSYSLLNGIPVSLTMRALPQDRRHIQKADLGLYAQDQWAIKRLTLNLGLRFDYYNGMIPEHHLPATQFVPARDFEAVHKAPEWKDFDPRLGASYDLFGNGRTALKVSFGRYVMMTAVNTVGDYNPVIRSVNSVARPWSDANGNYIPDCDLANFGTNGECGPIANKNFGKNNPNATRYADDVRYGFGARSYVWDLATEVHHELRPGISVSAGYYHNWGGGLVVTDNLAVGPQNYSPYCITAPRDPLLPGGGGYQVCGPYDINPDKFGQAENLVTRASNYLGKNTEFNCQVGGFGGSSGDACGVNDFLNVSFRTRLGSGIQFGGGVDTGRTLVDTCLVIDSPQALLNCRIVKGFNANTQLKLNGSYPLPANFIVSATFQNLPGRTYTAEYEASNAGIVSSLGRNLAGGLRSATVPLVADEVLREPRRTQVDLRLSKKHRVSSRVSVQANLDIYNLFNDNAVLAMNNTFGPQWRRPTALLPGRMLQLGGNVSF